jgi:hypothetical protein
MQSPTARANAPLDLEHWAALVLQGAGRGLPWQRRLPSWRPHPVSLGRIGRGETAQPRFSIAGWWRQIRGDDICLNAGLAVPCHIRIAEMDEVIPHIRPRIEHYKGAIVMKPARWPIAGTLALLGLGACTTQPWILSKSPDAITVRWYPDETSMVAADQLAAQHCQSRGKAARLVSDNRDGSVEIARYHCR